MNEGDAARLLKLVEDGVRATVSGAHAGWAGVAVGGISALTAGAALLVALVALLR